MDNIQVNNDTNGNPIFVCHFLSVVNDKDRKEADAMETTTGIFRTSISHLYGIALKKSRKYHGKKFHNKQYGGGIAFQCSDQNELNRIINQLKGL